MSWDVTLEGAGPVERREDGGTYALGGTTEANLNVTYNYSDAYKLVAKSGSLVDLLDGKTASETIPELNRMVERLGGKRFEDYWAPTPGNAGYALSILLGWARQYPDGTWRVT